VIVLWSTKKLPLDCSRLQKCVDVEIHAAQEAVTRERDAANLDVGRSDNLADPPAEGEEGT
jgi:hypothetical protein